MPLGEEEIPGSSHWNALEDCYEKASNPEAYGDSANSVHSHSKRLVLNESKVARNDRYFRERNGASIDNLAYVEILCVR
jgi:hypothetical protein